MFDGAAQLDGQDRANTDVTASPGARREIGFNPVIVNTGNEPMLFNTGNGEARHPARAATY